jgi:hypothetical protein
MPGVELQAFRRARTDVALRADRREHIVLNRLEIGSDGPSGVAGGQWLSVLIQAVPISGASCCTRSQQQRGPKLESVDLHDELEL